MLYAVTARATGCEPDCQCPMSCIVIVRAVSVDDALRAETWDRLDVIATMGGWSVNPWTVSAERAA
jgi:hypothetical protein